MRDYKPQVEFGSVLRSEKKWSYEFEERLSCEKKVSKFILYRYPDGHIPGMGCH